ncbi:MAG: hypothetical protein VKM68_01240 [Cyanobacteriota bacterium]|nr:hypothetical protein [Cyanobacteriota bacterium]
MTFLPLMAALAAPVPAIVAQAQSQTPPPLPPLPGTPLPGMPVLSQPLQDPWSRLPRELQTGPAVPRSLQVDSYDGTTL